MTISRSLGCYCGVSAQLSCTRKSPQIQRCGRYCDQPTVSNALDGSDLSPMMSSTRIYARARQYNTQSTITGTHTRSGISGTTVSRKTFLIFAKAPFTQFLDVLDCRKDVMLCILILDCSCPRFRQ
jgi:hypothetical protein